MELKIVDMIGWLLIILFVLMIIMMILGMLKMICDFIQDWFF